MVLVVLGGFAFGGLGGACASGVGGGWGLGGFAFGGVWLVGVGVLCAGLWWRVAKPLELSCCFTLHARCLHMCSIVSPSKSRQSAVVSSFLYSFSSP